MSGKKILNKMRACNARTYNVTKESNCALCCCTVGACIARPLSEFVQNFGLLIYEREKQSSVSRFGRRRSFFVQSGANPRDDQRTEAVFMRASRSAI